MESLKQKPGVTQQSKGDALAEWDYSKVANFLVNVGNYGRRKMHIFTVSDLSDER